MTREELLELLDSWENLNFMILEMGNHPELLPLLMEIALDDDGQKSWRAAWMADKIHDRFPDLIHPYLPHIIGKLRTEPSNGKKRQFLKLVSLNTIPRNEYGFLIDYCLDRLTSPSEQPAVRVHAMQILYNISNEQHDLKPEILAVIEHEMEYHPTPGILSRGKKLARKLHHEISNRPQTYDPFSAER